MSMWLFTLECGLDDNSGHYHVSVSPTLESMPDCVHSLCRMAIRVDLPPPPTAQSRVVRVRIWVSGQVMPDLFVGAGTYLPPATVFTTRHHCFYPSLERCVPAKRLVCGCDAHNQLRCDMVVMAMGLPPIPHRAVATQAARRDVLQWIERINELHRADLGAFVSTCMHPVSRICMKFSMPTIASIIAATPKVVWWTCVHTNNRTTSGIPAVELSPHATNGIIDIVLRRNTNGSRLLSVSGQQIPVRCVCITWVPTSNEFVIRMDESESMVAVCVDVTQKHASHVVMLNYIQLQSRVYEVDYQLQETSVPCISVVWGGLVSDQPRHYIPQLPCPAVTPADLHAAVQRLGPKLTPLQMGWATRLCDVVSACDPQAWRIIASTVTPARPQRFAVLLDGSDGVDAANMNARTMRVVLYNDTLFHSRQRRVVVLAGPPGLGKSYLVASLAAELVASTPSPVVRIIVPRHLMAQTLAIVLGTTDTSRFAGIAAMMNSKRIHDLFNKTYHEWGVPHNLQIVPSVCDTSALALLPAPDIVFLEEVTTVLTPSMRRVHAKFDASLMGVCSCKLLVIVSATVPRNSIETTRWCAAWRVWSPHGHDPIDADAFTPNMLSIRTFSNADVAVFRERRELMRGVPLIGSFDDADAAAALAQLPNVEWLDGGALPVHTLLSAHTTIPPEVMGAINVVLSICKTIPRRVRIMIETMNIHLSSLRGTADEQQVHAALCDVDPDTGMLPTFEVVVSRLRALFSVCMSAAESLADFLLVTDNNDDDDACAICVDALFQQPCVALKCSHVFHTECFRQYSAHSTGMSKCPMCRAPIDLIADTRVIDASAFRKRDREVAAEPPATTTPRAVIADAIRMVRDRTHKHTLVLVDGCSAAIAHFERRSDARFIAELAREMDVPTFFSVEAAAAAASGATRHRGLLILPMAFHTGMNFHTTCDGVVVVGHADPNGPNLATRTQIEGRIRRIGQTSRTLCATSVRSVAT